MSPEERAARRESTILKLMVKNHVDHDTAEAQMTGLAITAGFKTATDDELFDWTVKAGWAKPEDRRTPDLQCIQPDATERDKWGFGEVPAELTHETALLGWHQCADGKVRVNGAKCIVCNWVVPASTTGSEQP